MYTGDAWVAQDEGGYWIWDFGASYTRTFGAYWYASATIISGYCTSFSVTWYASNDGSSWTQFATYTFSGTATYGSAASPISSSITGTYRYIEANQYSTTSCMVYGYTYVDSVYRSG